eukprot:3847002-Pleurochrysis_carterae.AAC.2
MQSSLRISVPPLRTVHFTHVVVWLHAESVRRPRAARRAHRRVHAVGVDRAPGLAEAATARAAQQARESAAASACLIDAAGRLSRFGRRKVEDARHA